VTPESTAMLHSDGRHDLQPRLRTRPCLTPHCPMAM
jgi:hypothetical protein